MDAEATPPRQTYLFFYLWLSLCGREMTKKKQRVLVAMVNS